MTKCHEEARSRFVQPCNCNKVKKKLLKTRNRSQRKEDREAPRGCQTVKKRKIKCESSLSLYSSPNNECLGRGKDQIKPSSGLFNYAAATKEEKTTRKEESEKGRDTSLEEQAWHQHWQLCLPRHFVVNSMPFTSEISPLLPRKKQQKTNKFLVLTMYLEPQAAFSTSN